MPDCIGVASVILTPNGRQNCGRVVWIQIHVYIAIDETLNNNCSDLEITLTMQKCLLVVSYAHLPYFIQMQLLLSLLNLVVVLVQSTLTMSYAVAVKETLLTACTTHLLTVTL